MDLVHNTHHGGRYQTDLGELAICLDDGPSFLFHLKLLKRLHEYVVTQRSRCYPRCH